MEIVYRSWGHYKVLYSDVGFRVKELVIDPHSALSMQRHQYRSETWNIVSGDAEVLLGTDNILKLTKEESIFIPENTWHKGMNNTDEPAHIIEIWRGTKLTEDDIERKRLIM